MTQPTPTSRLRTIYPQRVIGDLPADQHPGIAVKRIRAMLGQNLRDMASDLHVSYQLLGDIERGRRAVSCRVAVALETMNYGAATQWVLAQALYDLTEYRKGLDE